MKISILFILILVLSGCNDTYDIKLKSKSIEYEQENLDVCQYIQTIGTTKVRDFNRLPNKIEEGDFHVSCPSYKIKKLGKQEVSISVNSIEVTLNLEVVDTMAPQITIDSSLTVEENNQYFDLKKLVNIKDVYDSSPIVGYSGNYNLSKPGIYPITINATDSSKNKSSKEVNIKVTEKEVHIVEKEVVVNNGSQSPNKTPTPNPQINENKVNNNASAGSLPTRKFLFSDGLDQVTGFQACKDYRGSSNGSCSPLYDENGDNNGYIYTP